MKPVRIVTIVVCAAILAVFAGILGNRFYRYSAMKDKLQEAVSKDAGYTETLLRIESESSHMTFGELFALCDKSIEGRTNLIIELRGLYPSINPKLKDELIDYLNAENEFARAKRGFYRKQMQYSSAVDLYKDAVEDVPASYYGADFYRANTARRKRETNDASLELQRSADNFLESYGKVLVVEDGMARAASTSGVRFVSIFKEYEKENRTAATNIQQYASAALR
jgi:hypothetical protein